MSRTAVVLCVGMLIGWVASLFAQQPATVVNSQAAPVPALVSYTGVLTDASGRIVAGLTGVTFLVYSDEQGGAPLWLETQNVTPDKLGHYTVQLGATAAHGLPSDLFQSGEARWLAVQLAGEEEQPRVALVAVPYAMKAADAATIGGLPPSAFVRATTQATTRGNTSGATTSSASSTGRSAGSLNVSGKTASPAFEKQNYVAKFVDFAGGLGNSLIFDNGTNVGVATATPAFPLDVAGVMNVQKDIQGSGDLRVDFKGLNTGSYTPGIRFGSGNTGEGISSARGGTTNVYGIDLYTNHLPRVAVTLAGNVGIGTRTPSDALDVVGGVHFDFTDQNNGNYGNNLAFGGSSSGEGISSARQGTTNKWGLDFWTYKQRRMSITSTGNVGIGTTSPAYTLDVHGTGNFTGLVNFAAGQTVTGNQTVNGNVSATGVVTGSAFQIGTALFAFGSIATQNTFLGFAGNTTTTGTVDVGIGYDALYSNTTGNWNTATGGAALLNNTTGSQNSAHGFEALYANTVGQSNTATGFQALFQNTTGSWNTADGVSALINNTGDSNTALGFSAMYFNTSGANNSAFGAAGLQGNTTGNNGTAAGVGALASNTSGSNNTAAGYNSLFYNTTGSYNTALGSGAGPDSSTPALTNSTAIGAYADVLQNNALVLGSTAAQNGSANVSVGIDVGTPTNILTVLQGGGHAIADGWDTYSSRRWKTNIHTLQGALEKVEQLRGVSYELKDSGKHEIGVIAEEVGAVVPEVVSYETNSKDARGVDYSRLTALLIEAIKEQQALIQHQQEQIRLQQAQIADLSRQVRSVRAALKVSDQSKAMNNAKAQLLPPPH